jgi:hypothetical protein
MRATSSPLTSGTCGIRAGSAARPASTWRRHPTSSRTRTRSFDAVVGSLPISLLRHADRVKIACLAQLVNVIAPIRTEPGGSAWRQTTYHPFALTSRHGRGTVLRVEPRGPRHETSWLGEVSIVDATAVPGAAALSRPRCVRLRRRGPHSHASHRRPRQLPGGRRKRAGHQLRSGLAPFQRSPGTRRATSPRRR